MLEGKVVLITGGSRGIGAASVRAAREAGADVLLHYARSEIAARAIAAERAPGGCHLVQSDLSEGDGAARLWDGAIAWKGRVDVLVNNAGAYTALELSRSDAEWEEGWEKTLRVNLAAPVTLMRRAIPHFRERGGGIIINVESRAAFRGDGPVYAHYAASKAGLMAFGRTVARAHAKEGILVFGIAPGWVRTDMAEAGIAELGLDYVVRDIPIGAVVPPEEIANLIVFLAAGKATHVTGSTIDINGASYPR